MQLMLPSPPTALALLCALLSLSLVLSPLHVQADVPADLVISLPGYGAVKTPQWSGWLAADKEKTVFLHYWFVTSSNSHKTDPVVVWMNGGPGCSSLEGALYELGPYTFTGKIDNQTGVPTLIDNVNGWTTVASMLFIEQPAGVGFSYYTNGSVVSDDYIQSQNTYGFMLNFFEAFPEYAANPFFVSGESYAGIYVPTLANRIVMGNKAGNAKINIQGILVGNGCWGSEVGTCSSSVDSDRISIEFFHGHSMIDDGVYKQIMTACGQNFSHPDNHQCQDSINNANANIGNIDIYDVYDTCNDGLVSKKKQILRAPSKAVQRLGDEVQCLNSELGRLYMDNKGVRSALHLDKSPLSGWSTCSDIQYTSNLPDERPMYAELIKNIRVLIYNGDADGCVPWVGNYEWVRSMHIPESQPWRPWMVSAAGRQWTGGFVVNYGPSFSFITIKHAGHMVPQYEPEAGLAFFSRFIKNRPLDHVDSVLES